MILRAATVAALVLVFAASAQAQQAVTLQFREGRVTLRANNAPVRTILAEWARLGGATVVNGERVAGAPITLELTDVPERQALDIVLRNVAGYMLGPRRAGTVGVSSFDRVVILPTSAAPRNPPPGPAAASASTRPVVPRPGVQRPTPAPDGPPEAPIDTLLEDGIADADAQPIQPLLPGQGQPSPPIINGQLPRPGPPPPLARRPVATPPIAQGGVFNPQPEELPDDPTPTQPQGTMPTAGNPFGVPPGSAATPGFIVPTPRVQPQPAPANPTNRVQ